MYTPVLTVLLALGCDATESTPSSPEPTMEEGAVEAPSQDTGSTLDCPSGESTTAYLDTDGDGYGRAYTAEEMCLPLPEGYVDQFGDCRDRYAEVYPGAPEYCDGLDNDCDGRTDEDPVDPDTFYLDTDFDGFGNSDFSVEGCNLPDGYVPYGGDCDDSDANRAPAKPELCDGIDNDCDDIIDENVSEDDAIVWYRDGDGDGYGSYSADDIERGCVAPDGYLEVAGDCDDTDPDIFAGAPDLCDGKDNDCDPATPADAADCPSP